MELRNPLIQSADGVFRSEGYLQRGVRVSRVGTLRSRETPRMYGNSSRENRETPTLSAARSAADRAVKAEGQTTAVHGAGESDGGVVPTNDPNNEGW